MSVFSSVLSQFTPWVAREAATTIGKSLGPDVADLTREAVYKAMRAARYSAALAMAPLGLRPHHGLAKKLLGYSNFERNRQFHRYINSRMLKKNTTYKKRTTYKRRVIYKKSRKWRKGFASRRRKGFVRKQVRGKGRWRRG